MKAKLTDTGFRSYQPRAAQYSIGDAACPGLCIRITPKGIKTFAFVYRNKSTGKVTCLTLFHSRSHFGEKNKETSDGHCPAQMLGKARSGLFIVIEDNWAAQAFGYAVLGCQPLNLSAHPRIVF